MAKEILIAVSEKVDQEEFKEILGRTEYRLIFADNGEDALQQIRFFRPSLVIAETALSEKSGVEICKAMRADRELKHIYCVLLKGVLEELSQRDVDQVQADGVISKPLHEGEVLKLVERLRDEGTMGKKKESLLEDLENIEDNDIIELVDVVEEPEPRLSIDDFLAPEKEEVATKMAPLESWDKQIGKEEKPLEEELGLVLEGLKKGEAKVEAKMEGRAQPKAEAKAAPKEEPPAPAPKAAGQGSLKDDLFEKVALEDIFFKVEKLKPVIEKELAGEKVKSPEEDLSLEEGLPLGEEAAEKPFSLEEFEAALQRGVPAEPEEGSPQPLPEGEPDKEALEEEVLKKDLLKKGVSAVPPAVPASEEKAALAAIEKDLEALIGKEKKAEVPLAFSVKEFELEEEKLDMEELGEALQPFMAGETKKEAAEAGPPPEVDLEEEELKDLLEEEFPEAQLGEELKEEEFPREFLDVMTKEEEIKPAEETPPEGVKLFEEETPDFFQEEGVAAGALGEGRGDLLREMEEKLFEEEVAAGMKSEPERAMEMEEMGTPVFPEEEEGMALGEPEERMRLPGETGAGPRLPFEEARPVGRPPDKQVEEILTKGVQAMMEDFVRKVVPEMTQNLLNVTMERIESMVKEVVPEIAEKAIKEEIRKLQEGDKE